MARSRQTIRGMSAKGKILTVFKPPAPPAPPALPRTLAAFEVARERFAYWLAGRGSSVVAPTNPFEIIRFLGPNNTCIVYRNGRGNITSWQNGADTAYRAFLTNEAWRVGKRSERDRKREQMVMTLSDRDGWDCLYCGRKTDYRTATIEHIVPLTSGGPDHPANTTLACQNCNTKAGHLSAREKFEMAMRKRIGLPALGMDQVLQFDGRVWRN